MSIDFCFQGWVRGADVAEVTEVATGNKIQTSSLKPKAVIKGLEDGVYALSLCDCLDSNRSAEIEIHDYDTTDELLP